ncbi:response regulator [Candidatus Uhrbacteria bacterium]|nr:response regulator [Candidatus Uhrbacteria bacterium]
MSGPKNSDKKKGTVLVIEDEPALVDIYSTRLEADGFDVISALDGVQGLDAAVHEQPSVILLDVILPMKNGFEVLKELKGSPKTRAIPVIILSNLGQDYEVKRGMSLGAAGFLIKANLTPAQVVEELERVIKKKG